jgi:hypothetical protein
MTAVAEQTRAGPSRRPRSGRVHDVVTPAPRAAWQAAYEADPDALVMQAPNWLDCICMVGAYEDASRLYDFGHGRHVILPLAARTGLPDALALRASPPRAWGMGGVVAPGGPRADEVAAIFADLDANRGLRTFVRPNPLQAPLWSASRPPGGVSTPRRAHVLDLCGGFDHVWKERFSGNARTGARKAERAGVVVERDTAGRLAPVFYALYLRSLDRWASKQHEPRVLAHWRGRRRDSRRKLLTIARTLGQACRIWVAWYEARPAAAILVLQGQNASYTRGAMDVEIAGRTNANDLLHRLAIEEACEAGCRYYHMGESGWSAPLSRFKSKFGAEAIEYADYSLERVPLTSFDRSLRRLAKAALRFKDDG